MKIGINGTGLVQRASVEMVATDALKAEQAGFSSYWLAEHPTGGFDALTVLALVGQQTTRIELGTAIVPTFPRHPMTLAGQALTASAASRSPITLGIGLSHQVMMASLGIAFDKPIGHLRDYLSVLMPLIQTGQVDFTGDHYQSQGTFFQKPQSVPSVLVAALGPQALRVAGHRTHGTTLAWVGPKTIATHIKPRLFDAAARANRPDPRILATLPVCITPSETARRAQITRHLAFYAELPSYKAMFEREGITDPGDLALVGSVEQVAEGLGHLADAGVTDFAASLFTSTEDEQAATYAFLQEQILSWTY